MFERCWHDAIMRYTVGLDYTVNNPLIKPTVNIAIPGKLRGRASLGRASEVDVRATLRGDGDLRSLHQPRWHRSTGFCNLNGTSEIITIFCLPLSNDISATEYLKAFTTVFHACAISRFRSTNLEEPKSKINFHSYSSPRKTGHWKIYILCESFTSTHGSFKQS